MGETSDVYPVNLGTTRTAGCAAGVEVVVVGVVVVGVVVGVGQLSVVGS
jgi:hypothetical protein